MSDFPVSVAPIQEGENCWKDPRSFLALLKRLLKVTIPDALFGKIWSANAAPPADKTDWVWERRAANGEPLGFFRHFNGQFVPVWPTLPAAFIIGFTGNPASISAPFAVCDGLNGTPDLRHIMCKQGSTVLGTSGGINASGAITVNLSYGLMQYVGY